MLLACIGGLTYYALTQSADGGANQQINTTQKPDEPELYDTYAHIDPDDIEYGGGILELAWNGADPMYGYNHTDATAVVRVITIDGGSGFNPVSETYGIGATYGKMQVKRVFKGELKPNITVNYSRIGGIVPWDDYWKSKNDEQRENLLLVNGGQMPPHKSFHKYAIMDDIDIEVGKTYLVNLALHYVKADNSPLYGIVGLQYGLREVRGSGNSAEILNNGTGKWEPLASSVPL